MTYQRDLKKLILSLDSLTNGQASVTVDEENVCKFTLTIVPNDGLYRNGKFDFEISFDDPSSYPEQLPLVMCRTPIYHPNIDNDYDDTNVCLSLFDEWDSNSLADIVQGLLFLFYNPNLEDPLSSLFDGSEAEDEFAENVRLSLMGELKVDGMSFEHNQVTDDKTCTPTSNNATENTSSTQCDTSNAQESNNTPNVNTSTGNTNVLETNDDYSNDITPQKTNELDDNSNYASGNCDEYSRSVTNPTAGKVTELAAAGEHDLVKTLDRQDSICTTINSKPTTPVPQLTATTPPTVNHKNYETWNMILGTATSLLTYVVFVNCDQNFYEVLR